MCKHCDKHKIQLNEVDDILQTVYLTNDHNDQVLTVSFKKTEFMRVGDTGQNDLDIGPTKIRHFMVFKYLGVTLFSNGLTTITTK